MPSASSKSEKPASTEAVDPLKQAIVIMGHKIRNLEKRKVKLDSYKDSIKSLTKEQVEAVAKYDEVVQQLELTKEYVKQFTVLSVESDKTRKKQAKKDAQDKYMADINRIKQVLQIQEILRNMVVKSVRQDFLTGQNGAVQLTEDDLKALDDLFVELSLKKSFSEDGTPVENDPFQKAAELFMTILDGKTKEVAGSTGAKLRDLVTSIHTCGYFEKAPIVEGTRPVETPQEEEKELHDKKEISNKVIVPTQNTAEGNHPPIQSTASIQTLMPGAPIVPGAQPLMQPNQHPILPPNVTNIVPTPVSQVESSFFNAQGFKPPAPPTVPPSNQNSRQINDVIQSVAGKFNFLQESELEISDLNSVVMPGNPPLTGPQMPTGTPAIPSQTFTNQNFNSQPGSGPTFPPNYNPQPAAFQTFVPAFPAFVPPNASPFDSANPNPNAGNPTTAAPVNNPGNPGNISVTASSTVNGTSNKCNNISNPIPVPVPTNRNANLNFNQGQQHLATVYPAQGNKQNLSQTAVGQPAFTHGSMTVGPVDPKKMEDAVRVENERKDKEEKNDNFDWTQPESTSWADEWAETSDWNSMNQNDGNTNSNKFSSGRPNRNPSGLPRNNNGYQGNRNRTSRSGGYRDAQNNQGTGTSNYYQNQNGYQPRSNDYSVGKGTDFRDSTFKERGDYNNRDRDGYGGGFKRGPNNRGQNMKGPMDRGDKPPMQIPRNNLGGSRGVPRNMNNRPAGGRGGPASFSRQQQNSVRTATMTK